MGTVTIIKKIIGQNKDVSRFLKFIRSNRKKKKVKISDDNKFEKKRYIFNYQDCSLKSYQGLIKTTSIF